ncbi:hypothetical protein LTR59_001292 [Friedmanniomyces endolithicus]|nr:hypothetical protein LTR59_001292 [Friedmanniomyces endolithicus]KAK0820194.1 hypothetical protein LTR38_000102 [Friedmanniomyces endolithicus]
MFSSLISASLFFVILSSSNKAFARAGDVNGTTSSVGSGHESAIVPTIGQSQTSLELPTLSIAPTAAITTLASTVGSATTPSYASSTSQNSSPVIQSSATSLNVPITSSTTLASNEPLTSNTATTTQASTTAASSTDTTQAAVQTPSAAASSTTLVSVYPSPIIQSSVTSLATPSTTSIGGGVVSPEAPQLGSSQTSLAIPVSTESSTTVPEAPATTTTDASGSSTSVEFTYAPETSTAASSDLLLGYIGSIAQSSTPVASTPTSAGASIASPSSAARASAISTSAAASPAFAYVPDSSTAQTSAVLATIVSVGSSAVAIAPVPQMYSAGAGSSGPVAFVIGSQTASVGQTLTVGNTPVVIQTSAGQTQLYAGTAATPSAISFAVATAAAASSSQQAAAVPATVSIGSVLSIAPVPQAYSAGASSSTPAAFVIGSQTASVGQTVTVDNTPVVVQTSAGKTQLYAGTAATPSALSFATVTAAATSQPTAIAPATVSIGSSVLSIAPVSYASGQGSSSPAAFLIGSQTASIGQTITIAGTLVVIQTSAGKTQLYAGTASPSALSFAAPTTAVPPTSAAAPTTLTLGAETISQDSAGNYLLGTQTFAPGSTITQGSGSSATIIALATVSGATQLIVQDASMTATTVLPPKVTVPASSVGALQQSSPVVVNGHTYYLGPASLNAQGTGSATASGTFVTSAVGGAASSAGTQAPATHKGAASRSGFSLIVGGIALVACGFAVLIQSMPLGYM